MGTASTGTQLMNNYQSWKHSQQPHPTTIRVKLREVGTGLWHWHKGKAALQRPAHSLFLSVIIHMTIGSQRLLSSRVLPHYLQEIKKPTTTTHTAEHLPTVGFKKLSQMKPDCACVFEHASDSDCTPEAWSQKQHCSKPPSPQQSKFRSMW